MGDYSDTFALAAQPFCRRHRARRLSYNQIRYSFHELKRRQADAKRAFKIPILRCEKFKTS
jgi:hypothetical protein